MYKKLFDIHGLDDLEDFVQQEEFCSGNFLKKDYQLYAEEIPFGSGYGHIILVKYNNTRYPIKKATDFFNFLNINTLEKFSEYFEFIHEYDLVNPYMLIGTPNINNIEFKSDELITLGKNHFKMLCNCLCNNQGRLSRMSFEIKNNWLIITEIENYTEESDVSYPQFD